MRLRGSIIRANLGGTNRTLSPITLRKEPEMSKTLYKTTAIEAGKMALGAAKIIAISATGLVACIAFWMYAIGWEGDSDFFVGMISYLVLGSMFIMISGAYDRAKLKEKYPDIDFS